MHSSVYLLCDLLHLDVWVLDGQANSGDHLADCVGLGDAVEMASKRSSWMSEKARCGCSTVTHFK